MITHDIYYVYLYFREDNTPYYVGKGSGNRAWSRNKRIRVPLDTNKIVIVAKKLFEHEAFLLEKNLIQEYGRKDLGTGILRNMTSGGDGITGYELIHKNYNDRYGKDKAELINNKKSKSMLGKNKGEKSGRWKIPPANVGIKLPSNRRLQLSATRQGNHNPGYDHTLYCWKNISTGETFFLTRHDFMKKFKADPASVSKLIKKNRKSVNGFTIVW